MMNMCPRNGPLGRTTAGGAEHCVYDSFSHIAHLVQDSCGAPAFQFLFFFFNFIQAWRLTASRCSSVASRSSGLEV